MRLGKIWACAIPMASALAWTGAEAQEFGNWTVACSQRVYCTATATARAPDGQSAKFKLERGPAADGNVFVTTAPMGNPLALDMRVEIDVYGGGDDYGVYGTVSRIYDGNEMTFSGEARRPLVERLRGGRRAVISVFFGGSAGTVAYEVALDGLTPALLEFDRRQGRFDREDAIVAWGGRPAGAPSDAPRGVSVVSDTFAYELAEIPAGVLTLASARGCDLEGAVPAFGARRIGFSDDGAMHIVSCHTGDVNIESLIAFEGADGMVSAVSFPPAVRGEDGRDTVVTPDWISERNALSLTRYYGPDADCGLYEEFSLDLGERVFTRVSQREKPQCDGVRTAPSAYPPVDR
ncbi:MAG: DUF1176 domain-containing protein [Pseudomonadota bacterium]